MEISKSKILITGGAGSIGTYFSNELMLLGAKVIVIDKNKETLDIICKKIT